MPSGNRTVILHRAHFTCVPGRGGFWPGQSISSHWKMCLFPLVWVVYGQSAPVKFSPKSLHPIIYSDLVSMFLSPFCTCLLCKIILQLTRVVDIIKSIHIGVYLWSGMWLPLMTMMWPQLCHVTALKVCAVLPWGCGLSFLCFPMWMSTLCCFPGHQSVHTRMVSGKWPGLGAKASDRCCQSRFL